MRSAHAIREASRERLGASGTPLPPPSPKRTEKSGNKPDRQRRDGGTAQVNRRGEIDQAQPHATWIKPRGLEAAIAMQDCAELLGALRA